MRGPLVIAGSPLQGLRVARPGEAVGGRQARLVGSPADPRALARLLAGCAADGLVVAARGAASKIDWGPLPARLDVLLDLARLVGPVEHESDNQLVRLPAGLPVRAAHARLSGTGQRLTLDPASVEATVGGVLATDEAGPLSHRYGPPSRQLVDVELALASGELVTVGPPLAPLLSGALGAFAVLTAATLRLHPRPARRRWLHRPVGSPLELRDLIGDLATADLPVAAVEVDLPATLEPGTLCVLVEGDGRLVARVGELVGEVLGGDVLTTLAAPAWWGSYPFGAGDIALRLRAPLGDLHAPMYALRDAAGRTLPIRGSAGSGCVYAALPGSLSVARVAGILQATRDTLFARGGTLEVLRAPYRHREALDLRGPVPGAALGARLKATLDPTGALARRWPA